MTHCVSTAPGKLVIAGEYAVLNGAPALAIAVNRRVEVAIRAIDTQADHHVVRAPGLVDHEGRFRFDGEHIEWFDGNEGFELVTAIWPRFEIADDRFFDITIDSRALSHSSGKKLGLGSSAAVTVALAGALVADGHGAVAADAHRDFQGGRGSGVDIACSTTGGVIEFEGGRTRSIEWPQNLGYTVYWSGQPASTRDKLKQLGDADSATSRTLYRAAQDIAALWGNDQLNELMAGFSYYVSVLRAFDIDHKLGIFDAGHLDLMDAAETLNMLYKPCGAGGGDLGILLYPVGADTTAFAALANDAGFEALDLAIDPNGLQLSQAGTA